MPETRRRLRMLARIEEMPQTSRPVASRPVQPVDAAALGRLAFAAYRRTIDDHGESEQDYVDELSATLEGRYGRLLVPASHVVADSRRELAAAALFTWLDGLPFLAFCLTHPRMQRRGLATALIADGARRLADDGHRELHLAVTEGNPAIALYERLGFREVPIPERNERPASSTHNP